MVSRDQAKNVAEAPPSGSVVVGRLSHEGSIIAIAAMASVDAIHVPEYDNGKVAGEHLGEMTSKEMKSWQTNLAN